MKDSKQKLVVITGPTASGKSSLAIQLALHFNGEIVNADSMQVYRGMDIGTAKPTLQKRKGIPHHMLDVADPDEDFNAAIYRSYRCSFIQGPGIKRQSCPPGRGNGFVYKDLDWWIACIARRSIGK